jgi:hypothetical protein
MISADGGFSAYASEASQINNNLQRYRSDIDNVRGINKQIIQEFGSKSDLDALRNVAGEIGAKGVKDVLSKYGSKLYDVKIGGKTLRQRDIEGSQAIQDSLDDFGKRKIKDFTDFLDRQNTLNEEKRQFQQTEDFLKSRTGTNTSETIGNRSVYQSITDEDLDIEPHPTRVSNPDAELSRPLPTENESNEISVAQSKIEPTAEMKDAPISEITDKVDTLDEGVKGAIDTANTSVGDSVASAGTSSGEAIGDAVADTAVKEGGEAVASAGLEAAGTALDATGVGAIVGVPLQIAGAIFDGGLLYEAGKSLVDWFDEDILGHKPKPPQNQLVQTPVRPLTLAERHLGVIPNVDTIDTQPSYSGGW